MFEITYNDSDTLQNFIDADKAYHGAVYDFTFEGRFIVYHFFVKDTARYVALDSMTGYGSEITRRRKDNLFDTRSYHSMTPMVLDSIKYTGDKRYLNVIVNNPLEAIESIFRTILPEYGFTVREDQIKLSQDMYLGLTGKQVAMGAETTVAAVRRPAFGKPCLNSKTPAPRRPCRASRRSGRTAGPCPSGPPGAGEWPCR